MTTHDSETSNFDIEATPLRTRVAEYFITLLQLLWRIARAIWQICLLLWAILETLFGLALAASATDMVIQSDADLAAIGSIGANDRPIFAGVLIVGVLIAVGGWRQIKEWFNASSARRRVAFWLKAIGGVGALAAFLWLAFYG